MGRVYAVSGPRYGPGDGVKEFESRLVCVYRRCDWLRHRDADDLVHECFRLSNRDRRQTPVQPTLSIPPFLRINDSIRRIRVTVWHVVSESAPTVAPSFTEEQTFFAGNP